VKTPVPLPGLDKLYFYEQLTNPQTRVSSTKRQPAIRTQSKKSFTIKAPVALPGIVL
jgi:hypothetical protein